MPFMVSKRFSALEVGCERPFVDSVMFPASGNVLFRDPIQLARLYVFADKWSVGSLISIALKRLHEQLCVTEPTKDTMPELIELIEYVYDNTSAADSITTLPATSTLRCLVLEYVDEIIDKLMQEELFMALLMRNHGLAIDGFTKLAKRARF